MSKPLNVIIGCEESGIVREAFRALGHNAWSCDLLSARDGSPFHIQDDVRRAISWGVPSGIVDGAIRYDGARRWWDLGIFHPTCTYLCNSGVRWFTTVPKNRGVPHGEARRVEMHRAAVLFSDLYHAEIPRVAIENPVMHRYARIALGNLDVPGWTQTIQPWQFGEPQFKRTCLWLRGLDPLEPTNDLSKEWGLPKAGTPEHKQWSQVHRASPGPDRARDRSTTYPGIAAAMAWQWGGDARGGE